MILSRYDPIPCLFDPYLQRLGNLAQMFASIPELPYRFHISRQALIVSKPVELDRLDDQVFDTVLTTLQCSAYLIYLPGKSGSLQLSTIRARPDYPIISSEFVHASLSLAIEVFSSKEPLAIVDQFFPQPGEQILAMPIFTGHHPAGVFVLVPGQE